MIIQTTASNTPVPPLPDSSAIRRIPTPTELLRGCIPDHETWANINQLRSVWLEFERFTRMERTEASARANKEVKVEEEHDEQKDSDSSSESTRKYRKARTYFQPHHLRILERQFQLTQYLSSRDRERLAAQTNVSEDRNRRMRQKKYPSCQ